MLYRNPTSGQEINTDLHGSVSEADYLNQGFKPLTQTEQNGGTLFSQDIGGGQSFQRFVQRPAPSAPSNLNLPGITGSNASPSSGTAENQGANNNTLSNTDSSIGLIDPLADKNVAARATEIERARNAINTQSAADLAAIDAAGNAAGLEYNGLIATAEEEKRQGMGSAIVTAGQRGGLMNTQFSGQAAAIVTPEAIAALETLKRQGFDVQLPDRKSWVGEGGKLESIQKVFSANITRLQDLQKQAIAAARSAAMKYQRDGKIENYNIAKDLYDQAKGLIKDSNDLKIKQAEAERNARNDAFTKERAKISDDLAQNQFDFEKYKFKYENEHPEVKTGTKEIVGADGLMHSVLYNSTTGATIQDLGVSSSIIQDMIKAFPDAGILPTDSSIIAQGKLKTSKIYQEKIRPPGGGDNKPENDAVSLYGGQIGQAILAGITDPDMIVSGIQSQANEAGVNLSVAQLNAIRSKASELLKGYTPPKVKSESQIQAEKDAGLTGIEAEIASIKRSSPNFNDGDIRATLIAGGRYSENEIGDSSIGSFIDKTINSIEGFIFGKK